MTLQPHTFHYFPATRTVTFWNGSIREPGKELLLMIAFTSRGHERSLWLNKLN